VKFLEEEDKLNVKSKLTLNERIVRWAREETNGGEC